MVLIDTDDDAVTANVIVAEVAIVVVLTVVVIVAVVSLIDASVVHPIVVVVIIVVNAIVFINSVNSSASVGRSYSFLNSIFNQAQPQADQLSLFLIFAIK